MVFSKVKVGMLALMGLAFVPAAQANPLQGFYLGANLGGSIVSHEYSYTNGLSGGVPGNEVSGNSRIASSSGSLGISGGYSHLITNCLMLGADLFLDGYFGGQDISQTQQIMVKAKRVGPAYGFLVRAGVVAYPKVLAYVGVGGKFSKFTYKIIDKDPIAAGAEASLTKGAFKPLVEVGLEGMFSNTHIGWRASYSCAFGRTANMGSGSFPRTHILNLAAIRSNPSAKFSSTEHGIKLGAFYRF